MNKFKWSSVFFVSAVSIAFFIACTKEASSKANYLFKDAPSSEAIFKVKDEVVVAKDFYKGIESDLYEAEMKVYEIKFARMQAMLMEKFMMADPNKKNLTNDEYLQKYITKEIKVSDKDIQKFITERQIPKEQINPEITQRIKEYIEMEQKKLAVDKWLAELVNKNSVEVYIKKPMRPTFNVVVGDAPFKGNADAKVTIVEFSDFQCPFCSKAAKTVADIEKKYGNKVKIAFKNFPLPFHNQAKLAAAASLCAKEVDQKYFWKMHDQMFADQTKLDRENLIQSAKKIGLKVEDFTKCLDSNKFMASVEADILQGNELGIKSTPTFFVNGQLISGALPIESFSEIIDEELSK